MEDKVYEPMEVQPVPFPQDAVSLFTASEDKSGGTGVGGQQQQQPINFPQKVIAQETIASSLNTKSRKILAQYEFVKSGAIQIGEYVPGVSGDIRISPDGFIARDLAGNPTVTIDGDTGDATLKGTVLADDFVIADPSGLVSLSNFSTTASTSTGFNQPITTTVQTDITGASLSFSLTRPALVLFLVQVTCYLTESVGNTTQLKTSFKLDSSLLPSAEIKINEGNDNLRPYSMHSFQQIAAGLHTIKLVAQLENLVGSGSATIYSYKLDYLIFGR